MYNFELGVTPSPRPKPFTISNPEVGGLTLNTGIYSPISLTQTG